MQTDTKQKQPFDHWRKFRETVGPKMQGNKLRNTGVVNLGAVIHNTPTLFAYAPTYNDHEVRCIVKILSLREV